MSDAQATGVHTPSFMNMQAGTADSDPNKTADVTLGPDGKPCRACTGYKSWATQMKGGPPANLSIHATMSASTKNDSKVSTETESKQHGSNSSTTQTAAVDLVQSRKDCPLDKEELGRNTWGFLHTMAAYFPEAPTMKQQTDMKSFITTFAQFYPCDWCAYHLRKKLKTDDPDTSNNEALSKWFCEYHNNVSRRLGKKEFDCSKVLERWKTGWLDGSCD